MAKRQDRPVLDVWLYGRHVATLSEPSRLRYRLEYTSTALDEWGDGARVLSLALPFSRRPAEDTDGFTRPVGAFLEGLLPEGQLLSNLATQTGVSRTDVIRLLQVVGRECAGAVQFVPRGEEPTAGTIRALSTVEVEELVSDLPTYHLPEGTQIQASLAGVQDKILLVEQDGGWGWPQHGAASTHIIKPEPLQHRIDDLVQAEDWALQVATRAGIPAAESRLATFGQREAVIVKRYDRDSHGRRVHQEDFAQALGLDPQSKYEPSTEGDRLRRLVTLAAPRAQSPTALRRALLSAVAFNIIIGNGDAHSKNYSVLIDRRGDVSLAPLYDTAPVMFLDSRFTTTGHVINGRTRIDYVTRADLVGEAVSWGLAASDAERTVRELVDRVASVLPDTVAPPRLAPMRARLDRFWSARRWLAGGTPADVTSRTDTGAPDKVSATEEQRSGQVWVKPYVNRRGSMIEGHWRSRPGPR